ncbi:MAG TPA: adenosylcobinamide-phosphate synthase CbiB [Acidimicrobiales bacterium]|jgi:adenosylcobinamide-phosphate synthase|nr:adenosylcobinamide-phosphate synthase CbiB [Acidimicrobiales bacterium]
MVSRRLLAVAGALAVDRMAGEPPGAVHPVAGFGRAMEVVERHCYSPTLAGGAVYAALGIGLGGMGGAVVRSTLVATYLAVGGRALADAAAAVGEALDRGDLDRARTLLPGLVGRDPDGLDEAELSRAVVESVAENTVDAVIAPALWAALAGAPGALGYRAINTMDAMVGHRSSRYRRFGTPAARLDDAANWVPARLTALLVAVARPHRAAEVWRTVRADAPGHPSPNSGVAEAAFAAALGVGLGGRNRYGPRVEDRPRLGAGPAAARQDIGPAVRLSRDCTLALAGLLLVGSLVAGGTSRGRGRVRP